MTGIVESVIGFAKEIKRRQLYKMRSRALARLQTQGAQPCFEFIFESNHWDNRESRSGNGSSLESTKLLRPQLESLLKDLDVKTFFDAPCGDWNWMKAVKFPPGMHYIGGDIVPAMIHALKTKHATDSIDFLHMNIIETPFPAADLWMCRDSLFHLSNRDIFRTLDNFIRSRIPYALLTTMPEADVNEDILTGSYRALNLQKAPFGFPAPRKILHDNPAKEKLRYLALWHRDDIARKVEKAA